jgi:phytoene dehydrogenase-like protein
MSEKYDVIIIGAGIGGLTCGCYLAKSGLKVLIIEQHSIPGGYCTSFQRKGYRFDAAVHYLSGVKRGVLGKVIDELNLRDKISFTQFDPTEKMIFPENITYIRANPDDTIEEFVKSFPRDEDKIRNFFNSLLRDDIASLISKIKKLNFNDLLDASFDNEKLKATIGFLLANIGSTPSQTSALAAAVFFREFIFDPGYYPKGGSQSFSNAITEEFSRSNGEILLSNKVIKILVKNDAIAGVRTEKGQEFFCDYVVSNIDATSTYRDLLGDINTKESATVEKLVTSCSAFGLFVGIKGNLNSLLAEKCSIWYSDSYDIERDLTELTANFKAENLPNGMIFFPSLHDGTTSADKNTIQSLHVAPFATEEFWRSRKDEVMNKSLALIKKLIPNLKDEHIDLTVGATPVTFRRYTSNRNGAMYGWMASLEQSNSSLIAQESSFKGLILAGHWCTPSLGGKGGIAGVASLGRNAARIIYSKFKKDWPWPVLIIK